MYLVVYLSMVIVPTIQAYTGLYLHPMTVLSLVAPLACICFGLGFAFTQRSNRIGIFLLSGEIVFIGNEMFGIVKRLTSFTLAQFLWGVLLLLGILALLGGLFILIFESLYALTRIPQYFNGFKTALRTLKKGSVVLFFLTLLAGGFWAITTNPRFGATITIQPQDYDIELRMWANYDPDYYLNHPYGSEMLDQLNRHRVIIQNTIFAMRDASGEYESFTPTVYEADIVKCVETLQWFAANYPQIRFQFYAYGLGGLSNGNYEGSIYTPIMLKRFVDVCRNYSLTNVVGVYTDWEGPSRDAPKYANETLNGWHQALWVDAMAYTRAYFPNWIFSCCYPDQIAYDLHDGDADLQYYDRYNIFMPMWDDYGPMVYRSCNVNKTAKGTDTYHGPWMIYAQARSLLNGTLKGDLPKASMWLGCTGCGPYHNASDGLAAFATDIRILKHFGYPSVSIFLGMDRFEAYGENMGFFDQYGYTDALDRLVEMINGPASTESFTIKSEGDWMPHDPLILDFQLNFDRLTYLPWFASYLLIGLGVLIWDKRTMKKST
jgi:hypothetical protein